MNKNEDIAVKGEKKPEHTRPGATVTPPVDIYENQDEVLVVADVPGVAAGAVDLRFDKDQLSIEAVTSERDESANPLFREYGRSTFRRVFELAPGIDVEKIRAQLERGVLHVHLPKAAALKPRKIEIETG